VFKGVATHWSSLPTTRTDKSLGRPPGQFSMIARSFALPRTRSPDWGHSRNQSASRKAPAESWSWAACAS